MSLLVFLDLETTGLEPGNRRIIECAFVITNDNFEEIESFEDLYKPPAENSGYWDKVALDMHKASGLFDLANTKGVSMEESGVVLKHYFRKIKEKYQTDLHLAGNSVHFDRSFMKYHWPDALKYFHHRQLDVSSLRMLGERILPPSAHFVPDDPKPHRAMLDVQHSLRELKHWTMALKLGKHEIY